MIDSGLLSGVAISDEYAMLTQRALAHQAGIPVSVFEASHLAQLERLAQEYSIEFEPQMMEFHSFCEQASGNHRAYLGFLRSLRAQNTGSLMHFPHPLYRQIKDHFAVRVYEALTVLLMRKIGSASPMHLKYIFSECDFSIVIVNLHSRLILIGPLFIEQDAGYGSGVAYFRRFSSMVEQFNADIDSFNRLGDLRLKASMRGRLYTTDYLLRLAFSRQKLVQALVEEKALQIVKGLAFFEDLSLDEITKTVTPIFFSKVAAARAASDRTKVGGRIKFKVISSAKEPSVHSIFVDSSLSAALRNANIDKDTTEISKDLFEICYAEMCEQSFSHWNSYIAESLNLLRNWLETSTIRERAGAEGEAFALPRDFGRRLARFMATTFNAYECTIYRASYGDLSLKLLELGAFSSDVQAETRLQEMRSHMDKIQLTPRRSRSVSFRCAERNTVQYCQYYDYATGQAMPDDQLISFPIQSRFKCWGVSACAIPIRVNGILWGVLQLIGRRPHCFPEIVRVKAEEACGIIGTHLFEHEMLASIYNINRTIGNRDMTSTLRRDRIEHELLRMFGCKTFAVVRMDASDRRRPISIFLESGRSDLRDAAQLQDYQDDYLRPLGDFLDHGDEVWTAIIGSREFRRGFGSLQNRRFYAAATGDFMVLLRMQWELSAGQSVPGIVVITYPHQMIEEENWREAVEFTAQYISTMSESLYSSDLWERRLRDKVGHELSKTALKLEASILRLRRLERREVSRDPAYVHTIRAIMGDLGVHSRALKKYVEVLTKDREGVEFDDDPRIYLVRQMREAYLAGKERVGVNLVDAYKTAFIGQSERFRGIGVEIPSPIGGMEYVIKMDDVCLADILSTLVDNLVKYTKPGTAIVVRESSTEKSIGFTVSNIGLRLDDDELYAIFDEGKRGRRAVDLLPDDGKGLGLWFAQNALHEWNSGLRHQQRKGGEVEGEYAWHDFTLSFLRSMIVAT